jgi:hypothetical protein
MSNNDAIAFIKSILAKNADERTDQENRELSNYYAAQNKRMSAKLKELDDMARPLIKERSDIKHAIILMEKESVAVREYLKQRIKYEQEYEEFKTFKKNSADCVSYANVKKERSKVIERIRTIRRKNKNPTRTKTSTPQKSTNQKRKRTDETHEASQNDVEKIQKQE